MNVSMQKNDIPWVEKYRPSTVDGIIMSAENIKIVNTILTTNYVPNILFYGPPGTGKTTTVVQIIKDYQERNREEKQGLMIHLNASDERGVEVIRNQINTFVASKTFFGKGLKFVVLDEVDYMTKNAQQALTYVLQENSVHVRFFLICNYISKIDETLQSYFMKMNFNHLPRPRIIQFLCQIAQVEGVAITDDQASNICSMYHSDIRSMINYIQLNKEGNKSKDILNVEVWHDLVSMLRTGENINIIMMKVDEISKTYNMDAMTLIKDFLNYAIIHYADFPLNTLTMLANAIHGNALPDVAIPYVFLKLLQNYHLSKS
jgi:replication factor C subunit 3/5